jgi:hypothetical protein
VTAPAHVERATLAQAVAAAVGAVPGVARLTGGSGVEAATLYPGGKVVGVVVDAHTVTVHVVAGELPLASLIARVRAVVVAVLADLGAGQAVDLVVEDLDLPKLPPHPIAVDRGRGQAPGVRQP